MKNRKSGYGIRMKLAIKIYDWMPTKFCWADLAMWGMGYKKWWEVFRLYGKPVGCVVDSMGDILESDDKNNLCYCGCWQAGHHFSSAEGKRICEKIKCDTEKREKEHPITEDLPF